MVSLIFGHFFLGGEDVFLAMYLDLDIGYYEVMQILDLETRSSQTRLTLSHYSKPHFFVHDLLGLHGLLGLRGLCQKIMKGLSFRGQKLLSDLDFRGTEKISDPTSEVIRGQKLSLPSKSFQRFPSSKFFLCEIKLDKTF